MSCRRFFRNTSTALLLCVISASFASAQTADYDQLVAQAQADLKAGNAAQALTESQKAIDSAPSRWEAYVLAGGALQVEQQYDKAVDDFTQALKLAPAAKQAGIKNLLEKCIQAQTAAQAAPSSTAVSTQAAQPALEGNVTQAEVVLWKTIQGSQDPTGFEAYLKQYPTGAYSTLARLDLDKLLTSSCYRLAERHSNNIISIKDQKEFNAYAAAAGIQDAARQGEAFRSFLNAYPNSTAREAVLQMLLQIDIRQSNSDQAMQDALAILQNSPSNPQAIIVASFFYNKEADRQTDPSKATVYRDSALQLEERCVSPSG